MKRLLSNVPLLRSLVNAKGRLRRAMLERTSRDLLFCISDLAANTLKGVINSEKITALRKHKKTLRTIASKSCSASKIRSALLRQRPTFFRDLISDTLKGLA